MVVGKDSNKIEEDSIMVEFEEEIAKAETLEPIVSEEVTELVSDTDISIETNETVEKEVSDEIVEEVVETKETVEVVEEEIIKDDTVYFNGKPYMEYFDPSMSIVERYSLELSIPEQFTEDDLRMLATMVFKENGTVKNEILVITDQYPDGVYMPADIMHEWTAQVCLNHIYDKRFPNTIYEDLAYPRYTTAYRSAELSEQCKREDPEQWERVVQSCLLAMNGYVDLPADVVCASNFPELGERYAAIYVDTGWFRSWSYFARA